MIKYLTKTYLRDVSKYDLKLYVEEDNMVVAVKKILKTNPKFITRKGLCLIDDGYYVVEVLPLNENYAMRVFVDKNKNPLEYYFDISKKNGFDEETKAPYYDDLFTDVIVLENKLFVVDENELKDAFNNGIITAEDVDLANETTKKLVGELNNNTNKLKLLDITKYLF